jgi:serine/threonine protein kinase
MSDRSTTDQRAGSFDAGSFRRSDAITGTASTWAAKRLDDRYILTDCMEVTEGGLAAFEACDESTGELVEVVVALNGEGRRSLARVTDALWLVNHPTLCSPIARRDGYLVFERMRGPRLSMLAERGGAKLHTAIHAFSCVVDAVAALHEAGLVHAALHPGAVRVGLDGASLGWFVSLGPPGRSYLRPGGLCALAPELHHGGFSNELTDVFALGATLYWTLTGVDPMNTFDARIARSRRPSLRPLDDFVTGHSELTRLVHDCMDANPHRRPANALTLQERLADVRSGMRLEPLPPGGKLANSAEILAATLAGNRRAGTSPGLSPSTWTDEDSGGFVALSLEETAWAECE